MLMLVKSEWKFLPEKNKLTSNIIVKLVLVLIIIELTDYKKRSVMFLGHW